jgi:maltose alpha-D-glucosyltransferase/alpha-amylase
MGEDLSLPDRQALRTPMQWSNTRSAGFSTAEELVRPVIADGPYGYPEVNVSDQRLDPGSLLHWFQGMIHTLRECPEVGSGICAVVPVGPPSVLVHRMTGESGTLLFLHNLGRDDVTVDVGPQPGQEGPPVEVFSDRRYDPVDDDLRAVPVAGSGYRWLRLRRLF